MRIGPQKRRAEKKDPKIGKGNKPTMVSYKPKNESMKKTIKITENELIDLVRKVLKEQTTSITDRNRKDKILLMCGPNNEINVPAEMICKRPTETGQKSNNGVSIFCDKLGDPIVSGGNTNIDSVEYDCGKKEITHAGPEAYKNIQNQEKQVQLDGKWLSQFCYIIKRTPRRFKACASKVS